MRWHRAVLVLALAGGALLRLPRLDLRPMHTDEAVHAIKFGALLEKGSYRYDRQEYHGPTLNYLTLLPAWLSGEKTLAAMSETTLRIVPVFFGLCLILLLSLLPDIGPESAAGAALFAAFSPALVFYSRYYIQETLLVSFAFGLIVASWRLFAGGGRAWAVMAGLCAGLMFATKETWIISLGIMGLSAMGVGLIHRYRQRARRPRVVPENAQGKRPYPETQNSPGAGHPGSAPPRSLNPISIGIAILSAALVWLLFFSSFFTNWNGLADSILAYGTYFARAGENARHGHPWYYFLQMLTYSRGDHGPVWTEAGIILFGLAGICVSLRRVPGSAREGGDLRLFLTLYALLMFVVVSIIPYKTPWLMLGALQPLTIVAGIGLSSFLTWLKARGLRWAGLIGAGLMISHLAWQSSLMDFRYYDDPVNPYVYSHPGEDVREIVSVVMHFAGGGAVPVQVVAQGDDYWPLPWYFRTLPRVGWWSEVGEGFVPTGVMLASPECEPALLKAMYETPPPGERNLYLPLFNRPMFLRPGKEIRGYITLSLRDSFALNLRDSFGRGHRDTIALSLRDCFPLYSRDRIALSLRDAAERGESQ